MIPKDKLKMFLLRSQVKGHYQQIADLADVSYSTVYSVLNNKFNNDKVISAAEKIANEIKKELQ